MTRLGKMAAACASAILFAAAAAQAQETSAPAPAPAGVAADSEAPALAGSSVFGDTAKLDETGLGDITGREDIGTLIASATQRNTVSNNSVTGTSVTGNVQIDGQAFQNLQGLAVISANSGNNVAINSAMNVTINMAPPR